MFHNGEREMLSNVNFQTQCLVFRCALTSVVSMMYGLALFIDFSVRAQPFLELSFFVVIT